MLGIDQGYGMSSAVPTGRGIAAGRCHDEAWLATKLQIGIRATRRAEG
jgi:hypothetical protein